VNAPAQLQMFEPDATSAYALMAGYLREAAQAAAMADKFDLLQMPGAVRVSERRIAEAIESALVLALYLDFLAAAEIAL
jgi:hypothetical protein